MLLPFLLRCFCCCGFGCSCVCAVLVGVLSYGSVSSWCGRQRRRPRLFLVPPLSCCQTVAVVFIALWADVEDHEPAM